MRIYCLWYTQLYCKGEWQYLNRRYLDKGRPSTRIIKPFETSRLEHALRGAGIL